MTISPTQIKDLDSVAYLKWLLTFEGCKECSLGFQADINGCCVSRGDWNTRRMIIGEAPGETEDWTSFPFTPFTGPAGKLLDQIFSSQGWDTNKDWYLTNIVLCRPIAPEGSGKENLTPQTEQRAKCRPYLDKQLELISPKIIVATGASATSALLGMPIRMGDYRGKLIRRGKMLIFPMLHPAALLHAQRTPALYQMYRQQTWEDIQKLKKIVDKEQI